MVLFAICRCGKGVEKAAHEGDKLKRKRWYTIVRIQEGRGLPSWVRYVCMLFLVSEERARYVPTLTALMLAEAKRHFRRDERFVARFSPPGLWRG